MKLLIRLVAAGTTTVVAVVTVLPLFVAVVVAGQLGRTSLAASAWDIPAELVPVFQESAQAAGIPWVLLAATASVATDFGRHAPDGMTRGDRAGTSIFPSVTPAILARPVGAGMLLITPVSGGVDPQDDRAAAEWLARSLAGAAPGHAADDLARPDNVRFWVSVVAGAPLAIAAVAPTAAGAGAAAPPPGSDGNPIRQFAAALLPTVGAPVAAANLDAIAAWAAAEGSCARFNPLDTTQPEPGATPFNTLPGGGHVWNYGSFDQGVQATGSTLLNGLYQPVIAALQAAAGVSAVERAVRQSPWGTGPFGSPAYSGRSCPPGPAGPPAPPVPVAAAVGPGGIPATIVARAAQYQAMWGAGTSGAASGYVLPIDPSWFSAHPDWLSRPHHDFPAIDIPVPDGTAVYAVTAGRVIASDEAGGATSCGHDVRLLGHDGAIYSYCHGSAVLVSAGQPVSPGQLIMRSGWSGSVVPAGPAGAHLHFQIDLPGRPGPVCPQPALAAWASGQPYDVALLPASGCVAGHLA